MRKLAVICFILAACGGDSVSSVYQKDQTSINEITGSNFSIVMELSDSNSQSISCHIDKECNSEVAQLVDITIENNEMHFNFEAIGEGETEVGIECTGTLTENHNYSIVVQ